MNQFLATLVIILLPGIIAAVICDEITVHRKWTSFRFSLYALVLGILSYIVLQLIYPIVGAVNVCFEYIRWKDLKVWKTPFSVNPEIPVNEVIFATILSLPVAFLAAYVINQRIFNKISQKIGVSSKYGDDNLYSYYLDTVDWIYVRDSEGGLTYQGRIMAFSETDQIQELVMSEVTVFRYSDSKELYSVPTIYLTKEMGKFVIETISEDYLEGAKNDDKKTSK
ncbi:MAG TPA: hypothetical protein VFX02_12620 [Gammaproteobacteria bacterium]|nr:hypothetical protein [Gammaproteobacteria bacterium]